jgi:hypothetical protein
MHNRFRHWLVGARGAATTEKLLVLLFGIVLVGGAFMVFGPMLAKKYAFVAEMIGGEPTPTLADGRVRDDGDTNAIWYVVFAFGATVFFLGFMGPLLFPRARQTRARILNDLADRFPVLTPLASPEARTAEGMDELRHLADEVNAMGQKRESALEIKPSDFGQMASPVDATMDGGAAVNLPPPPEDFGTSRNPAVDPVDTEAPTDPRQLALGRPDDEATVNVEPLSTRLGRSDDDDEIPFDAVSPDAKPQMRPDPRNRRNSGANRSVGQPRSGDSTTVDVDSGENEAARVGGDKLVADVLRKSGAFGTAAGDSDETIIRTSGALGAVGGPEPDAPTQLRDALTADEIRRQRGMSPDATLPAEVRQPDDPDATTQNYQSLDKTKPD